MVALGISEIIAAAKSLPMTERAMVVDSILRSMDPPDPDLEKKWASVAQCRLAELRSGARSAVDGEEVFARIRKRFAPE